jgi:protein O-GlcNAc transferase
MPDSSPADLHQQALRAHASGDRPLAAALCRELLAHDPGHADAAVLLAAITIAGGRPAEALAALDGVLARRPADARLLHTQGEVYRALRRLDDAAESLRAAVRIDPTLAAAHNTLGVMALDAGDTAGAIARLLAGIAGRADSPRLHLNLGRARQLGGDPEGAIASYREAIRLDPRYAIAHNNLGAALHAQGRLAEAAVPLRRAIGIEPAYPEAHFNLGNLLMAADDPASGLARYQEAVRLRPDYFKARLQMGVALESLGQRPEALAIYESLVREAPGSREARERMSLLLMVSNQWDRARDMLEHLAAMPPSADPPGTNLLFAKQMLCDWSARETDLESLGASVDSRLAGGEPGGATPFQSIVFAWPAARQLAIARAESRRLAAKQEPLRRELEAGRGLRGPGRLRIGYLSGDFYDHAVSHLTEGIFALHDRATFEVFAYSFGPDDGSAYRRRIERECEHFVDGRALRTAELARRIAADGIDILVDMMGFSGYTRLEVMAARPAPLQMSWLAYPGTTGADFIDYLLGDRLITPAEAATDFGERIVRLPHCYLPTNREQPIAASAGTRRDHGLPDGGFVFASINNSYKFEPVIYAVWMRILARVPGSVLWLKSGGATMEANLRREAQARGVSPGRILFARDHLTKPAHLARLTLADLFLDTHFYNAHTTAADALWAGLPVLTCPGPTFAGRVGASLLSAVSLPELIAPDLERYEEMAVELAEDRALRGDLRQRLQEGRATAPLFDTPRFVRNLERAFKAAWAIHEAGEKPRAIDLAA